MGASAMRTVGTRSHTPLQPAWLSIHSTARPARCSTSSRFSLRAVSSPPSLRERGENMQGTDTWVLVPQELARGKFTRPPRARQPVNDGVVGRP